MRIDRGKSREQIDKDCVKFFCVLLLFEGSGSAASIDDAKAFFDRYVQLERSFDPAHVGLYTASQPHCGINPLESEVFNHRSDRH